MSKVEKVSRKENKIIELCLVFLTYYSNYSPEHILAEYFSEVRYVSYCLHTCICQLSNYDINLTFFHLHSVAIISRKNKIPAVN